MSYPTSNAEKQYNSKDKQNVHISQSGPLSVANAHTSAEVGGAFATEDNLNPEINAIGQRFRARGPPARPVGRHVPEQQRTQLSSTQKHGQIPPASYGPTPQVPHGQIPPASYGQTPQVPHGQMPQVPHGQMPQVPHGQMPQASYGQTPQVPHGQIPPAPYGQTPQMPHGQIPPASYGQTPQVPHGQIPQMPYGQTYQPTQMPRATEGGSSSHDQQRNADRRRKNDRIPAVTAYGEPQRGRR